MKIENLTSGTPAFRPVLGLTAPYSFFGIGSKQSAGHLSLVYVIALVAMLLFTAVSYGRMANEGAKGSIEVAPDYWVRVTTKDGTFAKRFPPPRYAWADPAHDVGQAAIVPCHENLLGALQRRGTAETTAEDNLKTLKLVFGAYESAKKGALVRPQAKPD